MPELPEVEITARRLDRALAGAEVESALAPGMVTMKTFDPPLEALSGHTVSGVRRTGKMLVVEAGEHALLVHLMSAGRLQLFETRASLRDRTSRLLIRLAGGRELRLREFGTQQRAWAKLLRAEEVERDEAVATLGPDAHPAPPPDEFARIIDQPRHLHPLLRDQRSIADKLPMPLQVHRRRGEPCPRCGTRIEAIHFKDYVMCYCPQEQTDGRVLKDRRLSRLLK